MIRRALYAILAALLSASPALAARGATDRGNADIAYTTLMATNWIGSATQGHPAIFSQTGVAPLSPGQEVGPQNGWMWTYEEITDDIYAYWKLTGSTDALNRMKATWVWVQSEWSLAKVSACGIGTAGTAQDDTTWNANFTLHLYEATNDPVALTWAKGTLDCAYNRWYDTATGGGLYYDDSQTDKGSYQAMYVQALLTYAAFASDAIYLVKAQGLESWATTSTANCSYTGSGVTSACLYRSDGLWWANVFSGTGAASTAWSNATTYANGAIVTSGGSQYTSLATSNLNNTPGSSPTFWRLDPPGLPMGFASPYNINMAGSVTYLAGNMSWAVVEARLYAIASAPGYTGATPASVYLARAQATAAAILQYETVAGSGIFLDDRDAFTNGWAAYYFANEVVPILTAPQQAAVANSYRLTARSVEQSARDGFGGYSGDWRETTIWAAVGNGSTPYRTEVRASAVIWSIANILFAQ